MAKNNFFSKFSRLNAGERGVVVVVALVVLTLGALVAIVSLTVSRQNVVSTGKVRGVVGAKYTVDEAIQRTLSEIRQNVNDFYSNDSDATNTLYATFDPANDDSDDIVDCLSQYQWTEADHDDHLKVYSDGRVMCNYLGDAMENTRVAIVRHKDFQDVDNYGQRSAVYLINAVAKQPNGVLVKKYAVILVPLILEQFFLPETSIPDPTVHPFIASVQEG